MENRLMKLIYVSGSRADFGLFRSTLEKVAVSGISVSVCVTGTHFDASYGSSEREIEDSGIPVIAKIEVATDGSQASVIEGLSIQVRDFGRVFQAEQPDAIVLLGDRSEMLMAAVAALHINIPILHVHGGELSGTIDESMRHALSKLSHYHFVSTQRSRDRLIRMGESPCSVFVIGAPGLDDILPPPDAPRDIWTEFKFSGGERYGFVIFHPVVQDARKMGSDFKEVVDGALELLDSIVVFRPNSDYGREAINRRIDLMGRDDRIRIVSHLPRKEYLELLAGSDLLIGNSSSGIIEAASFAVPVLNIGDRQNFRERSENVFDSIAIKDSIVEAGRRALAWRDALDEGCVNVYGRGDAGDNFVRIVKNLSFGEDLLKKKFYE